MNMLTETVTDLPESCIVVIFGASGDLTRRKLIPALYEQAQAGRMPEEIAIIGISRSKMDDLAFRDRLKDAASQHAAGFESSAWEKFASTIHYHAGDATDPAAYKQIAEQIRQFSQDHGITCRQGMPNILFYLSVSPTLYEPIIESIGASNIVTEGKRWCSLDAEGTSWQRIVIEKPFGEDLASARKLNMTLGRVFEEDATYRIDHYLGKELVQNMLVLRFANAIFEPIWNRQYIDHVQVSASESIGIGSRAGTFFDRAGTLRDMIQSHLLQVLALVTMEPPSQYSADAIMHRKIDVLASAVPVSGENAAQSAALGRHGASPDSPAYVDLEGVDPARKTETYAAIRLEIDNWRWAGVPFYIRSGKMLAQKRTEIVIQFKKPPTDLFGSLNAQKLTEGNRLVIEIAPREAMCINLLGKVPGAGLEIGSAALDLDYAERFGGEPLEAYGPLLIDVMRGDRTLFKHRDEVEGSWQICEPFLQCKPLRDAIETYAPGSWGPTSADKLLARDGKTWHVPGC